MSDADGDEDGGSKSKGNKVGKKGKKAFGAAQVRRLIEGRLMQWIATLVRTLLDLTCFRLCCKEPRWGGA